MVALTFGCDLQGLDRRLDQEWQVGQLDPLAGGEVVLHPGAQPGDVGQVDLHHRGQLGRDLERLDHPPRDGLPQPGHLLGGPAQRTGLHGRCGRSGRRCRSSGSGRRRGRWGLGGLLGLLGRGQHVLLANPPADPGAGDGRQVDAVLLGQLAHQRGDIAGVGVRGHRGGRLRGRRGRAVLFGLRIDLGRRACFGSSAAAGIGAWPPSSPAAVCSEISSPPVSVAVSGSGASASGSLAGSGGASLGWADWSPTTASTAPTSTVSSSCTRISSRVPATGEGISVSTLSVETSSSGSSASTESPTSLSHRLTVPSVTLSPRAGRVTSVPLAAPPDDGAAAPEESPLSLAGSASESACCILSASTAEVGSGSGSAPPPPRCCARHPRRACGSSRRRIRTAAVLLARVPDHRQHCADLDGLVLLGPDLQQHPGRWGRGSRCRPCRLKPPATARRPRRCRRPV